MGAVTVYSKFYLESDICDGDVGGDVYADEFEGACATCGALTDKLDLFPGGICLACYEVSVEEDVVTRVLRKDLEVTFDRLVRSAVAAGVEMPTAWQFQVGSKTYGNSYRVFRFVGEFGGQSDVFRLGFTAAEAELSMRGAITAFELVAGVR